MMQMFPLLAISLIAYAILTLAGVAGPEDVIWHQQLIVGLPLPSGDTWGLRGGDFFLVASVGFLFVELIRATRTDASSITNHIFSIILAVICVLAFILVKGFGNSTFFIYMSMTFLDALAGMVVTTTTARRDLNVTEGLRA